MSFASWRSFCDVMAARRAEPASSSRVSAPGTVCRALARSSGVFASATTLIWQPHAKCRLQPCKQFHAFEAAKSQIAVKLRRAVEHRQRPAAAELLEQAANDLQYAFAYFGVVELCCRSGHRSHEGFFGFCQRLPRGDADYHWCGQLPASSITRKGLLVDAYAVFCLVFSAEYPRGMSVVVRSTPERSAPVRSVSRRIATPISAPLNFAPLTLASRKLTFRRCAR